MGSGIPKVFLPLGDVPLVVHSLRTLATVPTIAAIVLVVSADCLQRARDVLTRFQPWTRPIQVVPGGSERQDSVAAGVAAADAAAELLVVHDAARPFVSAACITACIEAAADSGAAIAAQPARDTIKVVGADQVITGTLDRQTIWLAQTPQAFRADLLRRALERARRDGYLGTDDAALVERLGVPVRIVPGGAANRKITTAEDLAWAEWHLRSVARPGE